MPAVLTHKTIMLLARERLGQIRDALQAKKNTRDVVHTDLEAKILALATQAYEMMSALPHPTTTFPGFPYVRSLGEGISKFAVMGAMGPDITAFSALFAPGQGWLFDTVHKGTPDASREMVAAGTCEFAIEFWRRASTAITDVEQLKKIRAYVLGHLCHLAGDILSHPFVNDLEWHQSTKLQNKISHEGGEGSHDARVAQKVLLRASTREGAAWEAWWPTVDEVPREFFSIYADTLEEVYTARSRRRTGLTEFETRFREFAPPELDADLIKDGYSAYRNGIVSIGYGYGAWHWVAFLLPIALPLMSLPIIAAALPHSQQLFRKSQTGDDASQAWFEMLALPVAFGGLASLIYGCWLASVTTKSVAARSGIGIGSSFLSLFLGMFGLISISDEAIPSELKWSLMIGLPAVIASVETTMGVVDLLSPGHKFRGALSLFFGAPILLFLLIAVIFGLVFKCALKGSSDLGLKNVRYWIITGFWLILIIVVTGFLAKFLRDKKIPEYPKFPTDAPHHVRLFDDSSLYADPGVAAPTLAQSFFSSTRRKLLKLWWEGSGDLFIRSDRYQLVFSFVEEGTNPQVVPAPVAPMTLLEFIHLLKSRVIDASGTAGKLNASVEFPVDPDYELPAGAVFADHGDDSGSAAEHDEKAKQFRKLPTTAAASDYSLYHAPKSAQAIRFGKNGALNNPFGLNEAAIRTDEDLNGYQYVFDPVGEGDSDTVMSFAADFAALLCLGGASHMNSTTPPANQIHQVFRNWCLDRRRENEWRMLVSGGAFSEKGDHPERFDPLMLRPTDPNAYIAPLAAASAAAIAEGERTSREMGWVPLVRQWLDMTQRPTSNPLAETRLHPENPTNHALSRGMAFLLDMSDPAELH